MNSDILCMTAIPYHLYKYKNIIKYSENCVKHVPIQTNNDSKDVLRKSKIIQSQMSVSISAR